MRKFIPLLLLLGISLSSFAQMPKDIMKEPIPVTMFQATYAFHIPGLDTKKLYGISHNIGGSFVYKTNEHPQKQHHPIYINPLIDNLVHSHQLIKA